jgi:hypothetical protein
MLAPLQEPIRYQSAYEGDSVDYVYSAMFPDASDTSSFIPPPLSDSYQPPPPSNQHAFSNQSPYQFLESEGFENFDSYTSPLPTSPDIPTHGQDSYQSSAGSMNLNQPPHEYFNGFQIPHQPATPAMPPPQQTPAIISPPALSPADPRIRLNPRMLQEDFGQTPRLSLDPRLIGR